MAKKERKSNSGMDIPDYQFEAIARCLLPKIQEYYESEEGRQALAEWTAKQESEKKNANLKT